MTEFVRFHEYNDHEGERWNWWLQVDGNEAQIAKLAGLIDDMDQAEPWFDLTPDMESERNVDLLVMYSEGGYYDGHNKVSGVFTCPDKIDEDTLYKGRIRDMFREA